MSRSILVLGTGAIGSSIGADLSLAGRNVILADQWPAHVDTMKRKGLRIITSSEEIPAEVNAIHLCEFSHLRQRFDIVLLTAKSTDTSWMVHLVKPYLKPDGFLVSIQNSLNDEWIAPIIGYERDVACVIELSAEMFEPGIVKRNTGRERTWFALGELHGRVTPRLQETARILSAAGKTQTTTNIWGAKWSKLTVNCMTQAVIGILGVNEWEAVHVPEVFDLCIALGRESMQVGKASGYAMEPIFGLSPEEFIGSTDEDLKKILLTLISHIGKDARNSILQDHLKGRKSEIDFLNGLVVKKGEMAGIDTPLNSAVVSLTHRIELGTLKPERANIDLLQNLLK